MRQSGKTTLLQTLPARWNHFDLERRADHGVISRDPDAFFRVNPRQVALDEAQVLAEILRQLSALGVAHDYSHYRTGAGAEVDLAVEGNFRGDILRFRAQQFSFWPWRVRRTG